MKGLIHNREAFLESIARRLGRERRYTGVEKPVWRHTPQEAVLQNASPDELVEVLKTQCITIHTDLIMTDTSKLAGSLQEIVQKYGGGPIVAANDPRFNQYGLLPLLNEDWPDKGVDVHFWDHSAGEKNIERADRANVGLTISDITLAESGTVVLFSEKDRGRTLSFLPATLIAIVPKSSIVPRMTQAARIMREKVEDGGQIASCVNFITGPSNSADIEMNLVVGVHGPVKAAYLVVEDV